MVEILLKIKHLLTSKTINSLTISHLIFYTQMKKDSPKAVLFLRLY